MRYLLIDRITAWQPGKMIKGIKNVAMSEDFLEYHFPRNPIMPGVLLLEAITQLTGWLEAASSDFREWFLVNKVLRCNFYSFALPGDQVEIEVTSIAVDTPGTKRYRGLGTVNGKKRILVDFEGELHPLEDLEERDGQKKYFSLLTRESRF